MRKHVTTDTRERLHGRNGVALLDRYRDCFKRGVAEFLAVKTSRSLRIFCHDADEMASRRAKATVRVDDERDEFRFLLLRKFAVVTAFDTFTLLNGGLAIDAV